MDNKIEVYIRPGHAPFATLEDKDIRVYYNGQWVDFRNGTIRISNDIDKKNTGKEE